MIKKDCIVSVKPYSPGRLDKPLIIVVSAKTLSKSTDRNLVKRRIREIMRPHIVVGKHDYKIFVNDASALDKPFGELKQEIENQL